ncbi:MAG: type II toxin-antitoxin system PemK/MazF family toxin [Bacteroidia bacterium]
MNLNPTIGAEIKKERPGIIVNNNSIGRLPLKIIVPLTDWKDHYEIAPWMVKIAPTTRNKLFKTSSADCFQIRSISEQRFMKKIGVIENEILNKIKVALAIVFSIED